MQLRKLLHDDDAVSPVIGVILMVAITVILAAVIASFVLGLGDQTDNVAPQVSFSFDYESATDVSDIHDDHDGTIGELTISHDGGNEITSSEMVIRGDGIVGVGLVDWTSTGGSVTEVSDGVRFDASDSEGYAGTGSTNAGDNPLVSAAPDSMSSGQSLKLAVTPSYDIDVVWDPQDTDDSSTLAESEGPDA